MKRKSKRLISMALALIMVISMIPLQVFAVDGGTSIVLPIGETQENDSEQNSSGLRRPKSGSTPVYISTGAVSVSLPSITKPDSITGSVLNARIQAVDTYDTVVAQTSVFSISSDTSIGDNTLYLLEMLSEGLYALQVVYGDVQNPTTIALDYALTVVDAPVITYGSIYNLTAGLNPFTVGLDISGFDGNVSNFSFALIDTDASDAEVACTTNYASTSSSGTYGTSSVEYQVTPSSAIVNGHRYALKITVANGDLYSTATSISTTAYEAAPSDIAVLEITANEIVPGQLQVKVGGVDADTEYTVTVALGSSSNSTNYVYNDTLKPTISGGVGIFDIFLTRNGLSLPLSTYGNTNMWITVSDDQGDSDYESFRYEDSNSHQSTSLSLSTDSDNQYSFTLVGENILLDLYEQGSLSFILKKYVSGTGYVQIGSTTGSVNKETGTGYWGPSYTFMGNVATTESLVNGVYYSLYYGDEPIAGTSTIGGGTVSTTYDVRGLSMPNFDTASKLFYFNFGQFPVTATLSGSSGKAVAQLFDLTSNDVIAETGEVSGTLNSSGYHDFSFVVPAPSTTPDAGHNYIIRFVSGGETLSGADYSTQYASMKYDATQILPEYISAKTPVFVGDTALSFSVSASGMQNVPVDYYMSNMIDVISEASDLSLTYDSVGMQYQNYEWVAILELNKPIEFGSYKYVYTKNYGYYESFATLPTGTTVIGSASTNRTEKSVSFTNCNNLNASNYTAILYDTADNGHGRLADLTLTKQDASTLLVSAGFPSNLPNGSYTMEVYADGAYVRTVSVYISWNGDDSNAVAIKGYYEYYTGQYYNYEEIIYQTGSDTVFLYTSNPDYAYVRYSEDSNFSGASYAPIRDYYDQYLTLSAGDGVKTIFVQFRTTAGAESDVYTWTCQKVAEVFDPTIVDAKLTVSGSDAYIIPDNTDFSLSLISSSQLPTAYVQFWDEKYNRYDSDIYNLTYVGAAEGGYLFETTLNSYDFRGSNASYDFNNYTSVNFILTDITENTEYDSKEIPISFRSLTNILLSDWGAYGGTVYTNGDYFVKGQASPNSTVTVMANSNDFQSTASSSGAFSVTVTGLTEGTHSITASDSVGLATNSYTYNLVVDKTSPVLDTFKATAESSNITLTWTTSDTDIAYYLLWKDDAALVRAADAYTAKSYITTGGIGSTFKVVAVDKAGNQSIAKEVAVGDDEPPTTPGTPSITSRGTTKVAFGWTASTDNVAVYQYKIYRDGTLIETVDYSTLSFIDTNLSENTAYTYKVYALDRAGNQSQAAETSLSTALLSITNSTTLASEYVKEERPTGVSASMTLDNSDSYYSIAGVTAKLQYKIATTEGWSELPLNGTAANRSGTWIIEDLPIGTYTVRFYVVDTEGTEKATAGATVIISQDTEPPVVTISKPSTGSTVGGKDFAIQGNSTDNVAVDRIVLSYSLNAGASFTTITTLTNEKITGRTSYVWNYAFDASALPSGEIIIKAVAYDSRDNTSNTSTTVTLDNTPPENPSDFYVGGDKDKVTVMWSYPGLVAGNDFSHFRVYRSNSADGEFSLIKDNLTSIGYYDTVSTGITTDATYYYYVTATDDYDNESAGTIVLSGQLIDDYESPVIRSFIPTEGSNLQKSVTIKVSSTDNYMLEECVIEYKTSASATWLPLTTLSNDTITRSHIYSYTWDISGLSSGAYDVRVSVYDVSGNDAAVSTRTYNITPYSTPVAPVISAVASGHKTVSLNWSYSGDTTSLSSFKLYRSENGVDYTYVGGLTASATSYQDKVSFSGDIKTYYYKLEAIDKYSASTESLAVNVNAISADSENPVAIINPENLIYAAIGESFSMTAAASTDNDAIASYSWMFGDGNMASGVDTVHVYSSVGDYTVTLTITDMYGNIGSTTSYVKVVDLSEEGAEYTKLEISVCDAIDLTAIGKTDVVINSEDFSDVLKTGADGSLTVIVPNGSYTIGVYADGYIVRTIAIVAEGGTSEHVIGLSDGSILGGSITAIEMTYDEIVAAGIDVNAEGNQHVYKFAVELTFVAGLKTYSLPYTVYKNERNEIVGSNGGGFSSFGGSGGSGGFNIGIFPITENFVLVIYGEARWLKEMYNVELVVINYSNTDTLDQVTASLELPNGLSLADMVSGVQDATQEIGSVGHSDTASINWYVRGDEEGEYNLTAKVSAISMPYGDVINQTFTTGSPLKVYAGSALKLTITADDVAERGKDYNVTFKLENVSDKSLYNLSFGITGSEQYKVIGIGDKQGELPIDSADYGDAFTYEVAELAPGGYFELKLSTTIWFNSALELVEFTKLGAFVDIAYYLTDVSVVALEGSTTVIPHEIVIKETEKKSLIDKVIFGIANDLWGDDLPSGSLGGKIVEVFGELLELDSTLIKGAKTYLKLQQGETDHKIVVSIDDGLGDDDSIYNDVVMITTGTDSQGIIDLLNGTKLTVEFGEVSIQAKGPGSTKLKIGVEDSLGNLKREYVLNITVEDTEIKNKVTLTQDAITGEFSVNEDALKAELKLKQEDEKDVFIANPFMWFESQLVFDVSGTTENSKFQLNIASDDFNGILSETATTILTIEGIAIYHLSIKIVSRGKGKSAVAAAAYRSGEKITNEYDGMIHDYTRKGGIAHTEILLPDNAPPEFSDRAVLWNAVEKIEKNKNAQLAREIELAMPVELSMEQNIKLVRTYCQRHFVAAGMCADICVHDKKDGNPHAHVMLTMRSFEQDGSWAAKSRKEYILDENGERIRPKSGAFKTRKVNTVDWNEQTKAEEWRSGWADICNQYLEQNNVAERIDHRSYERQGVEQIPTVHLGVAASAMEKRGIRTDRGNINRQVHLDNKMLRQLRARIIQTEAVDELFKDTVVGNMTATWTEPHHSYTITGGTIIASGANYVTFTGSGVVTIGGGGYTRVTGTMEYGTPSTGIDTDNVKRISGHTLISSHNAAEIAERLFEYYSISSKLKVNVIVGTERPGDVVQVFRPDTKELITATICKMIIQFGKTEMRAAAEMLMYYTPRGQIGTFKNYRLLTGAGTLTIASLSAAAGYPVTRFRLVVVGAGTGGHGGRRGGDGSSATETQGQSGTASISAGTPGVGGEAGDPGAGGKIIEIGYVVQDGVSQIAYTCGVGGDGGSAESQTLDSSGNEISTPAEPGLDGSESRFGAISSSGGALYPYGYRDPLSGHTLGTAGAPGRPGGPGGAGGGYEVAGGDGGDVPPFSGGPGGRGSYWSPTEDYNLHAQTGGGGGGGASASAAGGQGYYGAFSHQGYMWAKAIGGVGGIGAYASPRSGPDGFGTGGSGGDGGGGGGAGGSALAFISQGQNTSAARGAGGPGGSGGSGGAASDGCILVLF